MSSLAVFVLGYTLKPSAIHQTQFLELGNPVYSPISVQRLFCNPLNSDTLFNPFGKFYKIGHTSYLDFLRNLRPLSQSKHNQKLIDIVRPREGLDHIAKYKFCVYPLTRISVLTENYIKRVFVRVNGFVIV